MHVLPGTTSCGGTTLPISSPHNPPVPPPPWPTRNIPLLASACRPLPPWRPVTSWPVHAPDKSSPRSHPTRFDGRETTAPGPPHANCPGPPPSHPRAVPCPPPPPIASSILSSS